MNTALQDLRHALRLMGRAPGFTVTALAMLALAIGVNTAVFSAVYGVLLRPLPYAGADRIVRLSELHPGGTTIVTDGRLSNLTFDTWRGTATTIDAPAAYSSQSYIVGGIDEPVRIEGAPVSPSLFPLLGAAPAAGLARALYYVVTPGYAEALGLRKIEGRLIEPRDSTSAIQTMVVNESFAKSYLNDGQPVAGRRYQGLMAEPNVTTEIVGVVGSVLKDGLDREARPEMYFVHSKARGITREINLVIRTERDPGAMVATLRSIVRDVEPTAALGEAGPLASRVAASVAQPRFATAILAAFAALALALAATGLYGVLSYSVSQRRREIGIRSALGATRANVIALVVRQGVSATVAGLILGVIASALVTRLLQPLLFGITPLDLPSFTLMPVVLLVVALVACLVPARRAAATDPAITLRSE
jgi:hypothetical protein